MLHDISAPRSAAAIVLLNATPTNGLALCSSSLHTPAAFDRARTFRVARPAACPPATDTGPEITTHSTVNDLHTSPNAHTFPATTTYVVLVRTVTGSVFARTASVSDRFGAPKQLDSAFTSTDRFGVPSLSEVPQSSPGGPTVGYAGTLFQ